LNLDLEPQPKRVINATGVVLHTNLGRAPLSVAARQAVAVAAGYTDLEMELVDAKRAARQRRITSMLTALTGSADAFVTANNAAAVLLTLAALARGKEVIVSRGEAVEIGGGFRIPSILRQSGAKLVEVGTTNRTRLSDYEEAIGPKTAAILRVHRSNFRVVGFTESVPTDELARLSHRHGILLLDDNGSGSLLRTELFGLEHEPMPQESLRSGADVVMFSGDKLLGGPQAGIILGRKELVEKMRKHSLARAVRSDKLTLAALAATVVPYLAGRAALEIPVWQMISQSQETLSERASEWAHLAGNQGLDVDLIEGESTIGGGSLPGGALPTWLIALPAGVKSATLRGGTPAVLALTRDARALLDLRTVQHDEERDLLEAVVTAHRDRLDTE
jgi:L-seryl-tRNA(Ser) seleniumtransferase